LALVFSLLAFACTLYLVTLSLRAVLDIVRSLARRWRPRGAVLVGANAVYALTDPPLRALRRVIPPLRLGSVALDVGFILLFVAVALLRRLLLVLAGVF